MADDLNQAREQVNQARRTADVERSKNQSVREQLNKIRESASSQRFIRSNKGLTGLRARQAIESEVGANEANLATRERAVSQFTDDINIADSQILAAEREQAAFEKAQDIAMDSDPEAIFRLQGDSRAKYYYQKIKAGEEASIDAYVKSLKEQGVTDSQTLSSIKETLSINLGKVSPEKLNEKLGRVLNREGVQYENLDLPVVSSTGEVQTLAATSKPTLEVKEFKEPTDPLAREIYRQKRRAESIENRRFQDGGLSLYQNIDALGSSATAFGLGFIKSTRDLGETVGRVGATTGEKLFGLSYGLGQDFAQSSVGRGLNNLGGTLFRESFAAGGKLADTQQTSISLGLNALKLTPQVVGFGNQAFVSTLKDVGGRVIDTGAVSTKLGFALAGNTGQVIRTGNDIFAGNVRGVSSSVSRRTADLARTQRDIAERNLVLTPSVFALGGRQVTNLAQTQFGNLRELPTTTSNLARTLLPLQGQIIATGNQAVSERARQAYDASVRGGIFFTGLNAQVGTGLPKQGLSILEAGVDKTKELGRTTAKAYGTLYDVDTTLLKNTGNVITTGNNIFFRNVKDVSKSAYDSASKAVKKIDVGFGVSAYGEDLGRRLYTNPIAASVEVGGNILLGLGGAESTAFKIKNPVQGATRNLRVGETFTKEIILPSGERALVRVEGSTSGYTLLQPVEDAATGNSLFFAKSFIQRVNPAEVVVKEPVPILSPFFRPQYIEILPASTDVAASLQPSIFNQAGKLINRPTFLTSPVEEGVVTVNRLRQAAQQTFPMRNLDSIPEEQVRAFLDAFEKATGRPISKAAAERVFKSRTVDVDFVESEKLGNVVSLKDGFGLFKPVPGKTIERSGGSTVAKSIFKDDTKEIFQTESGIVDLGLPEVKGDTERVKGVLKVLQPRTVNKPLLDFMDNVGGTQKTVQKPLSNNLIQSIGQTEQAMVKALPKRSPPLEVAKETENVIGLNTRGSTLGAFAGQGTYERTEATIAPSFLQPVKDKSLERFFDRSNTIPSSATNLGIKIDSSQIKRLNTFFRTSQGQKFLQSQSPQFKEALMEGLITRQVQKLATRQTQRLQPRTTPRPRFRPKPRGFSFLPFGQGKPKTTPSSEESIFEVFTRRFGRDFKLGSSKSAKGAGDILESELKATLGASGFVEKEGSRVDPSLLGLGLGFGRAKRDRGRVVQLPKFRLGSFTERSEIQRARKKKRTKKFDFL